MKAAVLTCALAASCGAPKWHATPAQMAPLPLLPTLPTTIGPLALDQTPPATSWADFQKNSRLTDDHYLDVPRIRDEAAALTSVIDTYYKPLTAETKIGFDQIHQTLSTLERIAPYSMTSVTQAYSSSTQRLAVCVMGAGQMGTCDRERAKGARATPTAPYEIRTAAPGIPLLVVHDLNRESWPGFAADARRLGEGRGLLIDLRDAAGNDPRPLLAWVAKLTGRAAVKPLRAIERPEGADKVVAAYAAKFDDRGRDPDVWRTLIGDSAAAGQPIKQPISILVGRYCQSACEVIARSLQTYANATVVGGVPKAGRAARDEPALLYLPHSQTTVYFHATRYLFTAEVEAATGPSEEWSALLLGDGFDDTPLSPLSAQPYHLVDRFAWALHDIEYRIDHPQGWPRCDSLPTTTNVPTAIYFTQPNTGCTISVRFRSDAPNSAVRRFFSTCSPPLEVSGYVGEYFINGKPTAAVVSQIAGSELVHHVTVSCEYPVNMF